MTNLSDDPGYSANTKGEQLLNAAMLGADIRQDFERYLHILDHFYADDVEATSEGCEGAVIGKAAVRSRVAAFVIPMHVFAEVGGLSTSIDSEPIRSDIRDETHSLWTLEMTGVTGKRCVLKWRSCRRWRDGRVVYERHNEIEQTGGPLTEFDLHPLPHASGNGFIN